MSSNLVNSLRETESDGDSIYNCILNGTEDIQPHPSNRTVITVQPHRPDNSACSCPFPIVLGGYGSRARQILPLYGIQLLTDVDELVIQETIDLNDLFSMVETPGKYFVKDGNGDFIYGATEGSSSWQRIVCGSSRRFLLSLYDKNKQEALYFIRRLAPANPLYSCYLQRMDVFMPQCDYIGCVQQKWTPKSVTLIIRNYQHENMFEVKGPLYTCCSQHRELDFEVLGLDICQLVGKITHKWDESKAIYVLNILYLIRLDNKKKALILACAFLLQYIYFHVERSSGCRVCCK